MSDGLKSEKFLPKAKNAFAMPARGGLSNLQDEHPVVDTRAGLLKRAKPVPVKLSTGVAKGAAGREAAIRERLGAGYRAYKQAAGAGARLPVEWYAKRLSAGACEATGIAFGEGMWEPTIVRKDKSLGWTEDNCLLVCAAYAPFAAMDAKTRKRVAKAILEGDGE